MRRTMVRLYRNPVNFKQALILNSYCIRKAEIVSVRQLNQYFKIWII
jgi:hypothetical protein